MSRVLLVDDDRWLARLFQDVLEDDGHEVTLAGFGTQAMDVIDRQAPEVIIADVLLSGGTIFNLLHELQSYEDTASIPIVLCSSVADVFEPAQLKTYGVKRVLDKTTMQPRDITAAIRSVL